jgi:predicted nucleotidyltransferase
MGVNKIVAGAEHDILHITRSHGATCVRVFDSIFPEKLDSNYLGVLVDMADGSTLLDLVAIKQDLEELLDCEVHVVTESMLSGFRSRVLKEAVAVEV